MDNVEVRGSCGGRLWCLFCWWRHLEKRFSVSRVYPKIQLVSVEMVNEEPHPPKIYFQFITAVWKQHTESCTEETSSLAGCHGTLGHVPAGRWMEINRAVWGDAMITTFQMNMTMAHHDLICFDFSWKKKLGSVEDTKISEKFLDWLGDTSLAVAERKLIKRWLKISRTWQWIFIYCTKVTAWEPMAGWPNPLQHLGQVLSGSQWQGILTFIEGCSPSF